MTIGSAASYVVGQCTAFVANTFAWIPGNLCNADTWFGNAQKAGLSTTSTPTVGSVATWNAGPGTSPFGHVAVVTGIIPGGFSVIEQNFSGGPGVTDARNVTGTGLQGLQGFILPPGGVAGSGSGSGGGIDLTLGIPQAIGSAVTSVTSTVKEGAFRAGFVILGLLLIVIGGYVIASPQIKQGAQVAAKAATV